MSLDWYEDLKEGMDKSGDPYFIVMIPKGTGGANTDEVKINYGNIECGRDYEMLEEGADSGFDSLVCAMIDAGIIEEGDDGELYEAE